jgi:N-acetylglucosaminyldiphosphoundecaprenol N-acetyl-beta-D-mannosaminyltransferase
MNERIRIINGDFDRVTLEETVEKVFAHVRSARRGWLCTVNVATLMMMRADPWLQDFVDRASFVVADGQPLVWFAPAFGARLPARVAGIDLVDALSHRAAHEGLRVGLLGSERSVVEAAVARLSEHHPRLRITYFGDGFFTRDDAPSRAAAIRKAGVDILFVGMGTRRQEHFIDEQWERLAVSMAIGVGGSFDVLAGRFARAPELLQRTGLEWAFRLAQEPRRLWKRYLVTNSQFLYLLGRQLMKNAGHSVLLAQHDRDVLAAQADAAQILAAEEVRAVG